MCNMSPFENQNETNQQKNEQTQNFKVWVARHIVRNVFGKPEHQHNRNNDGPHHDQKDVCHPNDGENGVHGKQQVYANHEKNNLAETFYFLYFLLHPFGLQPEFFDTFPYQEESTDNEHQGFSAQLDVQSKP